LAQGQFGRERRPWLDPLTTHLARDSSRPWDMNLFGLLLPDFSARICGRSIAARLLSCQGRVDFSLVSACSGARYCRSRFGIPPRSSLIARRNSPAVAGRRAPWRLVLAVGHRTYRALPVFRRNLLLRSGVSRSASLATVGGEISILDQLRVVGDLPLMNRLPAR
jgi:hypothetical protein